MDRQILAKVCEQVYRQFPQVAGCKPTVRNQPDGQISLVFRGSGRAADGRTIQQSVRVTANPAGKILKITTSR
jgi:hypothetical protein